MFKLKAMFIALVGALALAAATAGTASATFTETTEECSGTLATVCLEKTAKLFEASGSETVTGSSGATLLEAVIKGPPEFKVHITCTGSTATGTLTQPAKLEKALTITKTVIEFTGCVVKEPAGCTVVNPIKTKEISGEVALEEEKFKDLLFTPTVGGATGTFAVLEISGASCPATLVGAQPVKGQQLCLIQSPETDAVKQSFICEHGESKLTFVGNPATFEATYTLELTSKKSWDIAKG